MSTTAQRSRGPASCKPPPAFATFPRLFVPQRRFDRRPPTLPIYAVGQPTCSLPACPSGRAGWPALLPACFQLATSRVRCLAVLRPSHPTTADAFACMAMSLKRARSPSPPSRPDRAVPSSKIYRSAPIEDRSSTFAAFYSPSVPLDALRAHPFFGSASHRIAAWRKPSSQRTMLPSPRRLYEVGHDDDGERYAGGKLTKIMEDMDVDGSLVVGRWYGGVLLGPVRFTHIENCAREAIGKWKEHTRNGNDSEQKRRKTQDDEAEKAGLSRELEERDRSIVTLRRLLDDKREVNKQDNSSANVIRTIDYSSMPVERLRQLDRARDATIAWLLREIDKADELQRTPSLVASLSQHPKSVEDKT